MSASTAIRPALDRVEILSGSRWRMLAAMVASDAAALLISVALGVMAKFWLDGEVTLMAYLRLWPFLLVFLSVYFGMGLYSGVALSPQEELRRTTYASTIVFLTLAAVTVSFRGATSHFTWTLLLSICISVALVPILRASVRYWLADSEWWGFPAVIFGSCASSQAAIRAMRRDPGVGLRPVAILDDASPRRSVEGVPMVRGEELAELVQKDDGNLYAVVVLSGQRYEEIRSTVDQYAAKFSHILIVPDLMGFSSYWVNEKMVGGQWGLEVCQRATLPEYLQIKRCLDLLLCLLLAPVSLPLVALIALWVKLDSPGPVFYGHPRIGRNGRTFVAWKFRSMVVDGDAVLARHLAINPAAREEWEATQKLANDPRVTRAGAILRKSSLDELPQLWNVLRGEMSHVGPRPIVQAEVAKYGESFELYKSVDGGMTGLWQVSGRSDTSYAERVTLDTFYARNWSIWLDFCILFRTIGAVLFRKGAY